MTFVGANRDSNSMVYLGEMVKAAGFATAALIHGLDERVRSASVCLTRGRDRTSQTKAA
jgi:hypothetical protein